MFQTLWEQEKRKSQFTWENRNKKHDAFAVHDFGQNVDRVVAPTTREADKRAAANLQRMDREKQSMDSKPVDEETARIARREREAAVKALDDEKTTLYNECKSALGEEEAKLQIQ